MMLMLIKAMELLEFYELVIVLADVIFSVFSSSTTLWLPSVSRFSSTTPQCYDDDHDDQKQFSCIMTGH